MLGWITLATIWLLLGLGCVVIFWREMLKEYIARKGVRALLVVLGTLMGPLTAVLYIIMIMCAVIALAIMTLIETTKDLFVGD